MGRRIVLSGFFLLIIMFAMGQSGHQFVAKGYKLDKYQKCVKDTILNDCAYSYVSYDYGQPPPSSMDLIRSYINHGFPDTIRGWVVKSEVVINMSGDYPMLVLKLTQTCINKINSLLPYYVQDMAITLEGINISVPEDELARRDKVIKQTRNE